MTNKKNEDECTNEFDDINFEDEEIAPSQTFSDTPEQESNLVTNASGVKYDWTKAPDKAKAPPRTNLDGKEVIIQSADITLPPPNSVWINPKKGTKKYKYCQFVVYYNLESQQEFLSGVRVFQDNKNPECHGHPTVTRDRKSQASRLIGIYADFKGKDIKQVSMREFLAFLNSKPKAIIKQAPVENPETGDIIMKNFVEKFI